MRHILLIRSFEPVEVPAEAIEAFQTTVTLAWVGGVLNLLFMIFAVIMLVRIFKLASTRARLDRVGAESTHQGGG